MDFDYPNTPTDLEDDYADYSSDTGSELNSDFVRQGISDSVCVCVLVGC